MTNKEVAGIFEAIADLLQLQGAEVFRVDALTDDLGDLRGQGRLESIPGIGKALAAKIEELLDTGELEFYRELLAEVPPGLVQMIEIPDLGPKTARRLYEELGIDTVEKLEEAARAERIRVLKGFGARSEEKLLNNLEVWRRGRERVLSAKALAVAEPLVETLAEVPGVLQVSLAGSLRRGRDTTKDIDLLV
ncbi:MAG: hypothetical protein HYU66_09380, partial [Armatimonadetes bacterium]|nr:hypothetical protein [Armatimonadota bacterium]